MHHKCQRLQSVFKRRLLTTIMDQEHKLYKSGDKINTEGRISHFKKNFAPFLSEGLEQHWNKVKLKKI